MSFNLQDIDKFNENRCLCMMRSQLSSLSIGYSYNHCLYTWISIFYIGPSCVIGGIYTIPLLISYEYSESKSISQYSLYLLYIYSLKIIYSLAELQCRQLSVVNKDIMRLKVVFVVFSKSPIDGQHLLIVRFMKHESTKTVTNGFRYLIQKHDLVFSFNSNTTGFYFYLDQWREIKTLKFNISTGNNPFILTIK